MNRILMVLAFGVSAALAGQASQAAGLESVYTDIAMDKSCTTYAAAEEGDGEWANTVCDGYKGYPVFYYYGDARESVFYGFPPAGEDNNPWESFSAFNSTGPKIEWRVETVGDLKIPVATIHRWFVSDPEDSEKQTEVLVVERVGQPDDRQGCAVGLVVASGNPKANETARRIADEQARNFVCGADEPVQVSGDIPLPEFSRQAN